MMKNNKIISLFVLSLSLLALNCSAQVKPITKEEYESAQRIAEANLEKIPYKSSTKVEEFAGGKLISTEMISEEALPPDKLKWTSVTTSGSEITKIERIYFGSIQYARENGGVWEKIGSDEKNGAGGEEKETGAMMISGQESPNRKKHTLEQAKLNNQTVRLYTVSTIYDYQPNVLHTYRRWINSADLILQSEDIESEINSGKIAQRAIETYEYNPKNIRIEAPVK